MLPEPKVLRTGPHDTCTKPQLYQLIWVKLGHISWGKYLLGLLFAKVAADKHTDNQPLLNEHDDAGQPEYRGD